MGKIKTIKINNDVTPKITRACEICGGYTDRIEDHICRHCDYWYDAIPSNLTVDNKIYRFCHRIKEMTPEDGRCHLAEKIKDNKNDN